MPKPPELERPPRPELRELGLLEFMPAVSPRVYPAYHFSKIADMFERAHRGNIRATISAPRQHGKTTLVKHAFPWWHVRNPDARIFYATYAQEYTEIQSRDIRRIYQECDIPIAPDHNTLKGWTLDGGTGGDFTASSVDGRANGLGANIIVVDDPFKGPAEAYSKKHRDLVSEWFLEVVNPMLAPLGSIFIIASRWDEDDLSGRLVKGHGYDEIRLEAINETDTDRPIGAALCPDGPNPKEPRNLDFLYEIRDGRLMPDGSRRGGIGKNAFAALYQGRPSPPRGALFGEPTTYTTIPEGARRYTIGVDIAYTAGEKSDFTVTVTLAEVVSLDEFTLEPVSRYYVTNVTRKQQATTVTKVDLRELAENYPDAEMFSYISGPERGVFDLLLEAGIVIGRLPARFNKSVRAQKTAEAWNDGRIRVPESAPWLEDFLHEIKYFTGDEKGHDDQVDGLVSGFDGAEGQQTTASPQLLGRRCM